MIALINFWWVNMGADVMVVYSMVYKFQSFRQKRVNAGPRLKGVYLGFDYMHVLY